MQIVEYAVSRVFNVDIFQLRAASRGRASVAQARQVAMYVAHCAFRLSHADVARHFERDRTTVGHACARVEDRREDPAFDRTMFQIEEIVRRLGTTAGLGFMIDGVA